MLGIGSGQLLLVVASTVGSNMLSTENFNFLPFLEPILLQMVATPLNYFSNLITVSALAM